MTEPTVPTGVALANSNIDDSTLLLLYDAMENSVSLARWSSIAIGDLHSDLETACNLRGINIAAGTKSITTVLNLLR